MANNQFLVSVADAVLRDPNTGAGIAYGVANLSSAFTLSMQKTEVRGGINNPLLYTYFHDRAVEIKIEQAIFTETVLALNAGTSVYSGAVSALKTECIVLASGSGNLSATPTGNVEVFLPNGTIQSVTATGGSITVSGGANQKVDVVYPYTVNADQVTVEAITPPTVVDLTLIAQVRDNTGVIVYYLQINVPRFQISGNYTMSLAANGVSNQAMDGTALVSYSSDCTTGNYYAKAVWVPAGSTSIPVTAIAATPSTISVPSASLPTTRQITLLGIRGGIYANLNVTSSASYVRAGSGSAAITVGAGTGVVTFTASGSAGYAATVTATYYDATTGSLTDTVACSVT